MSVPFNATAPIVVPATGRAAPFFIQYLQGLFRGTIQRTAYTFDEIDAMTPTLNLTVICSDANVNTIGSILVGGGSTIVEVIGDGSDWRVI